MGGGGGGEKPPTSALSHPDPCGNDDDGDVITSRNSRRPVKLLFVSLGRVQSGRPNTDLCVLGAQMGAPPGRPKVGPLIGGSPKSPVDFKGNQKAAKWSNGSKYSKLKKHLKYTKQG